MWIRGKRFWFLLWAPGIAMLPFAGMGKVSVNSFEGRGDLEFSFGYFWDALGTQLAIWYMSVEDREETQARFYICAFSALPRSEITWKVSVDIELDIWFEFWWTRIQETENTRGHWIGANPAEGSITERVWIRGKGTPGLFMPHVLGCDWVQDALQSTLNKRKWPSSNIACDSCICAQC